MLNFEVNSKGRSAFLKVHGVVDIISELEIPLSSVTPELMEQEFRQLQGEVISLMEKQFKLLKEQKWNSLPAQPAAKSTNENQHS